MTGLFNGDPAPSRSNLVREPGEGDGYRLDLGIDGPVAARTASSRVEGLAERPADVGDRLAGGGKGVGQLEESVDLARVPPESDGDPGVAEPCGVGLALIAKDVTTIAGGRPASSAARSGEARGEAPSSGRARYWSQYQAIISRVRPNPSALARYDGVSKAKSAMG